MSMSMQHRKKWINKDKKVSLLIKNFAVDKKAQKDVNNAAF